MRYTKIIECRNCGFKLQEDHKVYGDSDPDYYGYMESKDCPVCIKVDEIINKKLTEKTDENI